jgi:hypothetical protein
MRKWILLILIFCAAVASAWVIEPIKDGQRITIASGGTGTAVTTIGLGTTDGAKTVIGFVWLDGPKGTGAANHLAGAVDSSYIVLISRGEGRVKRLDSVNCSAFPCSLKTKIVVDTMILRDLELQVFTVDTCVGTTLNYDVNWDFILKP